MYTLSEENAWKSSGYTVADPQHFDCTTSILFTQRITKYAERRFTESSERFCDMLKLVDHTIVPFQVGTQCESYQETTRFTNANYDGFQF